MRIISSVDGRVGPSEFKTASAIGGGHRAQDDGRCIEHVAGAGVKRDIADSEGEGRNSIEFNLSQPPAGIGSASASSLAVRSQTLLSLVFSDRVGGLGSPSSKISRRLPGGAYDRCSKKATSPAGGLMIGPDPETCAPPVARISARPDDGFDPAISVRARLGISTDKSLSKGTRGSEPNSVKFSKRRRPSAPTRLIPAPRQEFCSRTRQAANLVARRPRHMSTATETE
jgi:hypothetical protein